MEFVRIICELSLEPNVLPHLREYAWSGNVVELSAALDKAIVSAKFRGSETISIEDFHLNIAAKANLVLSLQIEQHDLIQALEKYRGNIKKVTKALNIARAALYRKMKQFNIDPKAFRKKRL